ncbi:MAG TPA: neutral/alkaline non-lysosomal ceramidase N-terminal domain-containing protein [Bryobacteraceae bacterium]|nr:neutral/alkaline non-lysosomal ceramidase N-terminal domain-containing protein [Bryobacteraceae bacterium]
MKALLLLLLGAAQLPATGLRAGVARMEITPRGPIWMSGYASRNHPSTGVRQPLFARALAIEDGRTRTVIVTTDLIGLPAELADRVAARAQSEYGIERARLLLNSSHTHTGPVVWPNLSAMFTLPQGEEDRLREYASQLANNLVAVIGQAVADLSPATLSLGFGQAGFAVNRREPSANGVKIGVNFAGPTDREVPVIRVAAPDGRMRAILFAYACHNTTLSGDFYEITGDYAGFAEARLEADYPGAAALFLALCFGDQNPYPRGTVELAMQHGRALAVEVERVLAGSLRPLGGPVRAAYLVTQLPFAPQSRATYEDDLANPRASGPVKQRAERMLDRPVSETAYPVQAIRFAKDLTLVALGGEAVVDYDLRARREYTGEPLIVAAYSNSVMCYIPSERVLREGGYEAVDNLVYYGQPGPFAPGVEGRVFEAIHQVMKNVGRSMSPAAK